MTAMVLVVEDDFLTRLTLTETLQDAGYHVFEASTGAEALRVIEHAPDLNLLITDINLPGAMDGHALARAINQSHGHVKVLFTSGYSPGKMEPNATFLVKPYNIKQVMDVVRNLLE